MCSAHCVKSCNFISEHFIGSVEHSAAWRNSTPSNKLHYLRRLSFAKQLKSSCELLKSNPFSIPRTPPWLYIYVYKVFILINVLFEKIEADSAVWYSIEQPPTSPCFLESTNELLLLLSCIMNTVGRNFPFSTSISWYRQDHHESIYTNKKQRYQQRRFGSISGPTITDSNKLS